MKKPRLGILIAVTLLFAVFTLGFFLGRNGNHGSVELSVPAAMQTLPPQTTCPEPTTPETEVLANRIIAYLEENGSFLSTDELKNVEGIGEKRLEVILDLITIGG